MSVKKAVIGAVILGAAQLAIATPAMATGTEWSLTPTTVKPGGELYAETFAGLSGCSPETPVASPGLAAPIQWTIGGNFGKHGGYGKAGLRLGTYVASFTCADGTMTSRTFTVLGRIPVPGDAG